MTRYIFRRFYDTINKSTGNLWSTKEVLLNVLQNNLPWLPPGSTLHRIIKIYFSVAVDTADIERLMSVFSLQDNALNQHSTPARVEQMVRIKKESAPWQPFDFDSVLTIWQLTKGRKLPLPPVGRSPIPQTGKHLVKPSELIKEHHTRRLNAWRAKNAQQTYIYDSGSSASESDSEENIELCETKGHKKNEDYSDEDTEKNDDERSLGEGIYYNNSLYYIILSLFVIC